VRAVDDHGVMVARAAANHQPQRPLSGSSSGAEGARRR
jgi:hypothetical protein